MNYLSKLTAAKVEIIDDQTIVHCSLDEGIICEDDNVEIFYSENEEDIVSESGYRIISLKNNSGYIKPMLKFNEDDNCIIVLPKTTVEVKPLDTIRTIERGAPTKMFFTHLAEVDHFQ